MQRGACIECAGCMLEIVNFTCTDRHLHPDPLNWHQGGESGMTDVSWFPVIHAASAQRMARARVDVLRWRWVSLRLPL